MIVVTGAAGQVGSVLIKELVEQKKQVKAIVTPTDNLTALENYPIEIVPGDVRDLQFLTREFADAKQVYHLAEIVSITLGNKNLLEEVNVVGTKSIVKACRKNNIDRLIYTSSVHAFLWNDPMDNSSTKPLRLTLSELSKIMPNPKQKLPYISEKQSNKV